MKSDKPIPDRSGTRLDHRMTKKVWVKRGGKSIHVGYFDPSQQLYQWGGDLSTQVYWKFRSLTLGPEEWAEIERLGTRRLEFNDLKGNATYAIDFEIARRQGRWLPGRVGERFGIPFDLFDREDGT